MERRSIVMVLLLNTNVVLAQVTNTATMDSTDYKVKGKVIVEGYVDTYYAYSLNNPESGDQPYLVSMSRHNELNINLAFVDVKYSSSRIRARVVPGFGTYVNMNYRNEPGSLKNLIEANVGVKILKTKLIWLDIGILGSPYTNESAISKDHLAYTRSLAAENTPYYLSGAKLTLPLSRKVNAYLYFMNGWQQIADQNDSKSLGTQIEIRPNNNLLLNWNTYVGNENTARDSVQGQRYFTDVYFIFSKNNFSMTACFYYGLQKHFDQTFSWCQGNIVGRYNFTSRISGSLRTEYFKDSDGVLVLPILNGKHFETFGFSAGFNIRIEDNVLLRTEARQFISSEKIYSNSGQPSSGSFTLTASLCAWF